MIIVDASVLADFLLGRPATVLALEEESAGREHEPLHAPEVIELETLNALRRNLLRGAVDERRAMEAVADLGRTRLACFPHAPLRERVWELRHKLTAYDASYVALAELLEASWLLTSDRGLAEVAGRSSRQARVVTASRRPRGTPQRGRGTPQRGRFNTE